MPELPEVEVVRSGLAGHLPGRIVRRVGVLHPRPLRRQPDGVEGFVAGLEGGRLGEARRRGKFLWVPVADRDALVGHLGMSGQFRVDQPSAPLAANTRILFDLDDGSQLRFVDQRMFGALWFSPGGAELPPELSHVALDLFDSSLDKAALVARIRSSGSEIKRLLLNQQLVSGIGNIYADEALWAARVHPGTPGARLSARTVGIVLEQATEVMTAALAQGGTSFDALYVNVNGSSGYFSRALNAYGREGLPCPRCGDAIRRVAFTNRSSHYCPRCQRRR